jgi:transposase
MISTKKSGGPYTKKEQDERKDIVFELHFEKGYSAVKIAKMLGVNRNTVNKDIESCYEELSNDKSHTNKNWLGKQLLRLESQRTRFVDSIVDGLSLKDRLQLEKQITLVDMSIANLVVKLETSKKYRYL